MNTLRFALACAKMNWHVFPILPRDKRPATKHGVRDCSTDPKQLKQWFTYTDYNLGIAAGPSNLAIVDLDPRNGALEQIKTLPTLPDTPIARTGRGDGGHHIYFRAPFGVDLKNGKIGGNKGIDLKVGFGYVVAPPSVHESGGLYEWIVKPSITPLADLPQWIVDATAPEVAVPAPAQPRTPVDPSNVLARASKYLGSMPASISGQGGHNALLSAACAMAQGFLLPEDRALYLLSAEFNPRCKPAWSAKALQRKISEAGKLTGRHAPGWLLHKPYG